MRPCFAGKGFSPGSRCFPQGAQALSKEADFSVTGYLQTLLDLFGRLG
jgi:hypothetical protein